MTLQHAMLIQLTGAYGFKRGTIVPVEVIGGSKLRVKCRFRTASGSIIERYMSPYSIRSEDVEDEEVQRLPGAVCEDALRELLRDRSSEVVISTSETSGTGVVQMWPHEGDKEQVVQDVHQETSKVREDVQDEAKEGE